MDSKDHRTISVGEEALDDRDDLVLHALPGRLQVRVDGVLQVVIPRAVDRCRVTACDCACTCRVRRERCRAGDLAEELPDAAVEGGPLWGGERGNVGAIGRERRVLCEAGTCKRFRQSRRRTVDEVAADDAAQARKVGSGLPRARFEKRRLVCAEGRHIHIGSDGDRPRQVREDSLVRCHLQRAISAGSFERVRRTDSRPRQAGPWSAQ